jgi:hypothetical protein
MEQSPPPQQQQHKRKLLPPHPVGEKGKKYIASLDAKQLELHKLATELLGSSYFVEKSLGFRKWAAASSSTQVTK